MGAIKGYFESGDRFEVFYSFAKGTQTYNGSVDCYLTFPKTQIGQSVPAYYYQDLAVTLGAVNILNKTISSSTYAGRNFCRGDFDEDGRKSSSCLARPASTCGNPA